MRLASMPGLSGSITIHSCLDAMLCEVEKLRLVARCEAMRAVRLMDIERKQQSKVECR